AGLGLDQRFGTLLFQPRAFIGGAAILPDDCPVDRLARGAVPYDDRLALVGDADSGDSTNVSLTEDLARDRQCVLPNLLGIMFDPAALRIMLLKLSLGHRNGSWPGIEQDRARRRRALVDR